MLSAYGYGRRPGLRSHVLDSWPGDAAVNPASLSIHAIFPMTTQVTTGTHAPSFRSACPAWQSIFMRAVDSLRGARNPTNTLIRSCVHFQILRHGSLEADVVHLHRWQVHAECVYLRHQLRRHWQREGTHGSSNLIRCVHTEHDPRPRAARQNIRQRKCPPIATPCRTSNSCSRCTADARSGCRSRAQRRR